MAHYTPSRKLLRPGRGYRGRGETHCRGAIAIASSMGSGCNSNAIQRDDADAADLRNALGHHVVVAITDISGRIVNVNDRFCAISGYSTEELLGSDLRILNSGHHPAAYFRELWETIMRGEIWHGEIKNRAKDGSFYWVATTIVPFIDKHGTPRRFAAINSDITEQKRIEAELAERLRIQRLFADLLSCFVAVQSDRLDAQIEESQRQIVHALGVDVSMLWQFTEGGESMELTHSWQRRGSTFGSRFLRNADLPSCLKRVLRGEIVCLVRVSDLPSELSRDAETLRSYGIVSILAIPFIVNGRVSGAFALVTQNREYLWRDDEIIELKLVAQIIGSVIGRQRAERREEQLRTELAHATRVATLGELAATLAHELNQPLAAILSNAQAARRFIAANAISPDELSAIFDDIVRDDKRAGGIIHNLRAMVSKDRAVHEPCCINELVREVVDLVHAEVLSESVELRFQLIPGTPKVKGCRVELQQILMNLLINAVHAMKDVSTANRVIEIGTWVVDTFVVVRVRDYGHGIPSERLPYIFNPFFTTKPSGLGMGLSICRRIVENHGGRIEASKVDGKGACFSLWLPILNRAAV